MYGARTLIMRAYNEKGGGDESSVRAHWDPSIGEKGQGDQIA